MERFVCLGTPVQADESRSAAVCRTSSGLERVVIAARGYVLIVDTQTGECIQAAYPEGMREYPFASLGSSSGLYYTGSGPMLMVLDPLQERFTAWMKPAPEDELIGMALAEDQEGNVYATTYPGCQLVRVHGATGASEKLVRLDTEQKYAMSLAAGQDGWIYAGIGTTEAGIAAYCLADGTLQILRGDVPGIRGSGHVHMGTDGLVYASLPPVESSSPRWYRLEDGKATPVEESAVAASIHKGSGYNKLHGDLAGGRKVVGYQLSEGELVIEEPDGSHTVLPLQYEGNGTALSPIAAGPDGKLYGTSNHPLHLYRYDAAAGVLRNYGGKLVEKGGGGNICAYAAQGPYLVGAAYAGGLLHLLDTRLPLSSEAGPQRNPRLVYADERIQRPRAAFAHPDGKHVLVGGFPGYGAVGGGLVVLNVEDEQIAAYGHEQVAPNRSTLGLGALSCGDIVGGTSIETPGGAEPLAEDAVLYRMNWQDRQVTKRWIPIPGAREISMLVVDENDLIHGLTSSSIYFVFDPEQEKVLCRHDLSRWGTIVRQGMILVHKDGQQVIIGLLSRGIFEVRTKAAEPELITLLPKEATSGIALLQGSIYYGCGSELWSYHWEEEA